MLRKWSQKEASSQDSQTKLQSQYQPGPRRLLETQRLSYILADAFGEATEKKEVTEVLWTIR